MFPPPFSFFVYSPSNPNGKCLEHPHNFCGTFPFDIEIYGKPLFALSFSFPPPPPPPLYIRTGKSQVSGHTHQCHHPPTEPLISRVLFFWRVSNPLNPCLILKFPPHLLHPPTHTPIYQKLTISNLHDPTHKISFFAKYVHIIFILSPKKRGFRSAQLCNSPTPSFLFRWKEEGNFFHLESSISSLNAKATHSVDS